MICYGFYPLLPTVYICFLSILYAFWSLFRVFTGSGILEHFGAFWSKVVILGHFGAFMNALLKTEDGVDYWRNHRSMDHYHVDRQRAIREG